MTTTSHQAPQDLWDTLARAERDAAYDNGAAVTKSDELIVTRDRLAATYRRTHPAGLDRRYGPRPRMAVDVFPASDPLAPCLVFLHGGYWQRNSGELFAHYAEGALAMGWSVAMPSYTLAPEASVTQIVAETRAALDWLRREGPSSGIAGPIVASGWSAGAHLAAMCLDHPSVVAGLAISGVYDLGPIRDTYLNEALHLTDDEITRLSPLRLPVVNKPFAIAYGTEELPALIHDAYRFHAMRRAAGALGPLIPVEGADHFTILDGLLTFKGVLARAARDIFEIARQDGSSVLETDLSKATIGDEPSRGGVGPLGGEVAPAIAGDGVSLMITRRQREALRALGISAAEIAELKPAEAHNILKSRGVGT